MDPSFIFGALPVGTLPRPQTTQSTQYYHPQRPPLPAAAARVRQQHRDDDGDGSSNRIAHTLTACCRCRQVCFRYMLCFPNGAPRHRSGSVENNSAMCIYVASLATRASPLTTDSSYSAKHDATRHFRAAFPANVQAPFANTLTPPKARRSTATM